MRLSKETQREHLEIVRRYLVRMPRASIREMARLTSLSPDYCWKLMKKIANERAERLNYQTLHTEVAKYEDTISELAKECWKIIQDNNVQPIARVKAVEALMKGLKSLFDVQFDAGVFQRKLGEMDIKQFSVFIDLVKASVEPNEPIKPTNNRVEGDTKDHSAVPEKTE